MAEVAPLTLKRLLSRLRAAGDVDERVLNALASIPREAFVPRHLWPQAYEDYALEIGEGQTISQPSVVARMTTLAEVQSTDRVLEIGTGSGYQAAVLARLARFVFTVERIGVLAQQARERLRNLGIENVTVQVMDGSLGWRAHAPYDVIVVTAGAPQVPRPLVEQLAEGGRLVVPVGSLKGQELLKVVRQGKELSISRHGPVAFVPLVGREAFPLP